MGKPRTTWVSCGILRAELELLIRDDGLDGPIVFLDAALHVNFDKLKEGLIRTLAGARRTGGEVKVLYGACHPEMAEILEGYGARRMAAGNCLEALVGADEIRRLQNEAKTFFLSAGWIDNWQEMFALGEEDFDFDFQSLLRPYERVIVFEVQGVSLDEDKLAKFQALTGLPVERMAITLDHLRSQLCPL